MMLELNQAPPPAMGGAAPRGAQGGESSYKVLVIDQYTKDILAPLVHVNVLRQHGVTMHLMLESEREAIPGVPAVYFVRATPETVQRLLQDAQMGLYDTMHLNFAVALPRRLMEDLARGMVQTNCMHRVAKLYDQYLSFMAVESGLFTLGLPHAYTDVNNPDIQDDAQFAAAIKPIVDGLFCFLATMGAVPLIRCPPGGIAEAVATALERRVREALSSAGSNVFVDARRGGPGIGAPQQVLLCLFDRDFDLSVMLEHAWMYKALVQDVLGMRLNKITLPQSGVDAATQPGAAQRCFEVDDDDFFWRQNGGASFQEAAERVDDQLQKYKKVMDDVNQHTGVAGGALDDAVLARANQQLMSAVKSLPDLLAQKRILDKHMVLLHTLLAEIKGREIDSLHQLADNLLSGKAGLEQVVQRAQHGRGNATDKLRVALIFLLVVPTLPSDDELRPLEEALQAAGADTAAFSHIRRNRRLNLTSAVKQGGGAGGSVGGFGGLSASQGNLLSFMDSTFGQGIAKITSNMKHMFAGARQAVLTMAVASLMEAKPGSEADTFLVKDPRSSSPDKAAAAAKGMFREAVVFMVGGGNYLECMRLHTWAAQSSPPRNIVYGTTELLSGAEFAAQLAELGRKCGA